MCPEGEGMDDPLVLDLARGLEVGGGVGRGAAARPQQQDPGGARQLLLGVLRRQVVTLHPALCCDEAHLEDHPRVVPRGGDVLRAVVVHLQHQVLDARARAHPATVITSLAMFKI